MINNLKKRIKNKSFSSAFTIVELIIVVVVIGILATISIVVYPGARDKAIKTSITTQLVGSASDLKSFRFNHDKFPATIDCSIADSSTNFCIKPGDDVSYTYRVDDDSNPQSFTLYAQSLINNKIYSISDSSTVSEVAVIPPEPTGWKQISVGDYHTCAIASDNQAYCWGYSIYGQLGDNTTTNHSSIPVAVYTSGVLSGKTIKSMSAGDSHVCVIASDNQAYCWGRNNYGQLGNNSTTNSLVPFAVDTSGVLSGKTIKSISAGWTHTCAIASDNQAYCWGDNEYGQLGNNSTTSSSVPVAVYASGVLSGKTIKSISAGYGHTCVIASDDQAYCWGYNHFCQFGNNSATNSSVPVAVYTLGVLSGKTIKSISAGYGHTCIIASDDQAYCWGYNNFGQLGNNSTTSSSAPVAVYASGVLSGKTIKSMSAGDYHTCAIASDNQAYCWGHNNFGQFGNNSATNSSVPVAVYTLGVLSGKTIKSITARYYHTCAIASDNQAYCWGHNNFGQLGNKSATGTDSSVPVQVVYPSS